MNAPDLFTVAEQRKRERDKDELLEHCALLLTKALKRIDRGRIGDNIVRKEIKQTIAKVRKAG